MVRTYNDIHTMGQEAACGSKHKYTSTQDPVKHLTDPKHVYYVQHAICTTNYINAVIGIEYF